MIGQETVNEFNTGGSHKVNPYRGIPIGGGNRVEEGETSVDFGDGLYIFSDKLFTNDIDAEFPMKLPDDLTFAEASEYIGDQFKEGGMIDSDTELEILAALRTAQEVQRERLAPVIEGPTQEFEVGGFVDARLDKIDSLQEKQGTVEGITNITDTAGSALMAIPGPTMVIGGALKVGSMATKMISGAITGNKIKDLEKGIESDNNERDKRASETSAFATKVFPLGGLIPYPNETAQIPPDSTRTDSLPFDYTKPLQPIPQDTTNQQFVLPRRDTIKEFGRGGLTLNSQSVGAGQLGNNLLTRMLTPANTPAVGRQANLASQRRTVIDNPVGNTGLKTTQAVVPKIPGGGGNKFLGNLQENIGTEGIIGLGTQLATGLASNIIGLSSTERSAPVPRYDIAQERNANLIYTDETRREIGRATQTQTQALANRSGGDFGQFASNIAAVNTAGANALGQSFIQQQQINNQEQLATDQFNFRQRGIQARSDRQADDLDAQNEGAYQNQRNAYRDALFANVASFGETLNTIGQGDVYLDALDDNAKISAAQRLQIQDLQLQIANLKR